MPCRLSLMGITPFMPRRHRSKEPGSGGWIRTTDLRVMSPTSCHCSTPRRSLRSRVLSFEFSVLSLPQGNAELRTHNSQLTKWRGARSYAPSGHSASTIGAARFHDPVRDGAGWVPRAMHTPLAQGPVPMVECLLPPPGSRPWGAQGSPRPCALLASTPRRAFSRNRFTRSSPGGLTGPKP